MDDQNTDLSGFAKAIQKIKENSLSVLAGAMCGGIFALFHLPLPAPPVLPGIAGIYGVYVGWRLTNFIRSKTAKKGE